MRPTSPSGHAHPNIHNSHVHAGHDTPSDVYNARATLPDTRKSTQNTRTRAVNTRSACTRWIFAGQRTSARALADLHTHRGESLLTRRIRGSVRDTRRRVNTGAYAAKWRRIDHRDTCAGESTHTTLYIKRVRTHAINWPWVHGTVVLRTRTHCGYTELYEHGQRA